MLTTAMTFDQILGNRLVTYANAYEGRLVEPLTQTLLVPGTHLVIPWYGFAHHGLYVGDGRVVHYGARVLDFLWRTVREVAIDRFSDGRPIYVVKHVDSTLDVADAGLLEAVGEWVDGEELGAGPVGVFCVEPLDAGVGHFPAAARTARLGREKHVLALAKFIAHERLIEPNRAQIVVAIADQHTDAAFAKTAGSGVDFGDDTADGLEYVGFEIGDGAAVGEVLVVAREEENEVTGRVQVELGQ